MQTNLEHRRVLVTAGAAGIGRHIAEAFLAEGARVHVCDLDEAALGELMREQPRITGSICDVSDRDTVARMMEEALAQLGGLDVLVNNAGIAGATAALEQIGRAHV